MEVEVHEKKGHRAFAKAIKSLGSHRRSNCDLDKMCGKDALYASDKTFVQPKQVEGMKTKVKSDLSKEAQPARGAQSSLRKEYGTPYFNADNKLHFLLIRVLARRFFLSVLARE
ncbi:hypothetical protein ZWY2020_047764 [Hordeum vulgare]|nr:hypothetical protein ZWY2020_047764 [Hordeum vulgare]